jgi:hypothetical protein
LKALADRQNWPTVFRREMDLFHRAEVSIFIRKAYAGYQKKYFSQDAWKKKMELASAPGNDSLGVAWNSMYQDVRAALAEDPGSDKAQAVANRWMNLVERTTGGDPKIKMGMIRASLDSNNWLAWGQTRVES